MLPPSSGCTFLLFDGLQAISFTGSIQTAWEARLVARLTLTFNQSGRAPFEERRLQYYIGTAMIRKGPQTSIGNGKIRPLE